MGDIPRKPGNSEVLTRIIGRVSKVGLALPEVAVPAARDAVRLGNDCLGTLPKYLKRQKAVLVNALQLDAQSKSLQTPTIMINITPTQLRKAADIQEKIQSLQNELAEILGGVAPTPAQTPEAPKRRKFSAAAKAKMRAAQKARWAKIKATAPEPQPAPEPKRKLSAQGIANIRAGVAKRMAAQGKAPIANPVKKARKKISAAGLANIRAAQMARWAKANAAK